MKTDLSKILSISGTERSVPLCFTVKGRCDSGVPCRHEEDLFRHEQQDNHPC